MKKWMALALVASLPAQGFAGGNPLVSPGNMGVPAGGKKAPGAFKNEAPKVFCDEMGRPPNADQPCTPIEPLLLPRDGVSDEMLQKYKIRKD